MANIYKTMGTVLNSKKTPSTEEINKIPSFMFCRYLSGSPMTILAANQINYYYNMPVENQYSMIKNAYAGKVNYIPYVDNRKQNVSYELGILSKHFNISTEKAREYLQVIDQTELNNIMEMYNEN